MSKELEKELGIYISPEEQLAYESAEKEHCYKRINELNQENKTLQIENSELRVYIQKQKEYIEYMRTEVNVIKLENAVIKSGAGIKHGNDSSLTPRELRLEAGLRSLINDYEKRKNEIKELEARLNAEYKAKVAEAGRINRHQEVLDCLNRNNRNVRKTAKELGMTRQAVYQHTKKKR